MNGEHDSWLFRVLREENHEERTKGGRSGPVRWGPGHGGDSMFSELCRETLRKAAVCYSARAGSPSPSPPTSPPPSPAKEAKTAANADLANVRDAIHEGVRDHHHHSGTIAGKRASPTGNITSEPRDPASERSISTDRPNDFREYVYVRCATDIGSLLSMFFGNRSSINRWFLPELIFWQIKRETVVFFRAIFRDSSFISSHRTNCLNFYGFYSALCELLLYYCNLQLIWLNILRIFYIHT